MRTKLATASVLLLVLTAARADTPAIDKKKIEAELKKNVIDPGIRDLEAKDWAGALKLLAGPVAEIAEKEGKLPNMIAVMNAGMGAEMLKGLKAAKEARGTVDDDGQSITFDIADKFPDAPKMTFRKGDKGWYLD